MKMHGAEHIKSDFCFNQAFGLYKKEENFSLTEEIMAFK
jgi:hypothetical protein